MTDPTVRIPVNIEMPAPLWHHIAGVAERNGTTIAACTLELVRRALAPVETVALEPEPTVRKHRDRVWTDERSIELAVRNAQGESDSTIARAMGLGHTTVLYHRNRLDLPRRDGRGGPRVTKEAA